MTTSGPLTIRITQDGHTLTRFVRRADGEWREAPPTSKGWRDFDANRLSDGGHEKGTANMPTFYGVGIVDLPNGQKLLEVETQRWEWEGGSPIHFAQPIHGQPWGDDGRKVRVVYRFPDGPPIGHDKMVSILNILAANGFPPIEVAELRVRLRRVTSR